MESPKHIVSLLPAATEWIVALGAGDRLVGRSHACNYPLSISKLPALTRPAVAGARSGEIDDAVQVRISAGLSDFHVDGEALLNLAPDLIVTQIQCGACAETSNSVRASLSELIEPVPDIYSFDPRSFKDVLAQALQLARRLDLLEAGMAFLAEKERGLRELQDRIGSFKSDDRGRSVLCIEWLEPLMTSGNWVPDIVELAGGRALCTTPSEPSSMQHWSEVAGANPDVIALMPCGYSIERTTREIEAFTRRKGWKSSSAVRNGRVFAFDGEAYFNRPGPRLYRSIELMSAALHGSKAEVELQPWEMRRLRTASQAAG